MLWGFSTRNPKCIQRNAPNSLEASDTTCAPAPKLVVQFAFNITCLKIEAKSYHVHVHSSFYWRLSRATSDFSDYLHEVSNRDSWCLYVN